MLIPDDEVIELTSDPEQVLPTIHNAKRKGKGKATQRRSSQQNRKKNLLPPSDVIEITDSDSDDKPTKRRKVTGESTKPFLSATAEDESTAWPSRATSRLSRSRTGSADFIYPGMGVFPIEPQASGSNTHAGVSAGTYPMSLGSTSTAQAPQLDVSLISLPDEDEDVHMGGSRSSSPVRPAFASSSRTVQQAATGQPAPSEPSPPLVDDSDPEIEEDIANTSLAKILEIVPDVDPDHVSGLIEKFLEQYKDQVVQPVLHMLFEDPGYPKAKKKGKEKEGMGKKREMEGGEVESSKRPRIDYLSLEREAGKRAGYFEMALNQLQLDFPLAPKPYLRRKLAEHKNLYAPTWLQIKENENAHQKDGVPLDYPTKTIPFTRPKGKAKELHDEEFEEELKWVQAKVAEEQLGNDKNLAELVTEEEYELAGDGIECGCCFAEYPFHKITQCPETHLFCTDCITRHVSTKLGELNINITCIDQSGCKAPLPDSELQRFLPEKLWGLYERLRAQKAVEDANLEGLEECPFCDWKCVIDLPFEQERLFRCGNEEGGCGAVSCRQCKKPDHLPKSCKEAEQDKVLDGQHAVEEAMTQAMMRNCPKCGKAFVKEHGCNKMTCPHCRTVSCYVCRNIIRGYDHFDHPPGGAPGPCRNTGKCPLWDQVEQRHANEVKEAAEKALAEIKARRPDIDEKEIKVDIPVAPPVRPGVLPAGYIDPMAIAFPPIMPGLQGPPGQPIPAHQARMHFMQQRAAVRGAQLYRERLGRLGQDRIPEHERLMEIERLRVEQERLRMQEDRILGQEIAFVQQRAMAQQRLFQEERQRQHLLEQERQRQHEMFRQQFPNQPVGPYGAVPPVPVMAPPAAPVRQHLPANHVKAIDPNVGRRM